MSNIRKLLNTCHFLLSVQLMLALCVIRKARKYSRHQDLWVQQICSRSYSWMFASNSSSMSTAVQFWFFLSTFPQHLSTFRFSLIAQFASFTLHKICPLHLLPLICSTRHLRKGIHCKYLAPLTTLTFVMNDFKVHHVFFFISLQVSVQWDFVESNYKHTWLIHTKIILSIWILGWNLTRVFFD